MTALSHAQDTVAAHDAADYMDRSGKSTRHKARCIEAISKTQGMTAGEVGKLTNLGHTEAQRRISDLKNDGLVEYRGRRKCSEKKTQMSTIYLTTFGASVMGVRYVGRFNK